MERFLGALEHSFWLYDQVQPIHFALRAKVTGQFSRKQLRQALKRLQMQHPLLRVKIAVPDGRPKFIEQEADIPVRVVLRQGDNHWQQELAIELSESFAWYQAPLVRVVHLQSKAVSDLIVTFHHAIADGLSGAYAMRDLVQSLEADRWCSPKPLSDSLPVETLIPDLAADRDLSCRKGQQADGLVPPSPIYPTVISSRPRPHLQSTRLSTTLTGQLRDRARTEQTTVHGAISAAFLLALARQQGETRSPLRCLSPVNVRSHLTSPVDETVGLFIGYGLTHHEIHANSSLWDIARALTAQLAARSPELWQGFLQREAVMATCPEPQIVMAGMQQQYGYDLLVTNLGPLPFTQQVGSLRLEELHGPAVMTGIETGRVVGVSTLGDCLSVIVAGHAQTASAQEMSEFLAIALQLLGANLNPGDEPSIQPSNPRKRTHRSGKTSVAVG
jgi:hypothetical protein